MRSATDLPSAIAAVRANGRQRDVACPAHEDDHASLSVGRGDNGSVLLHCHAGCLFDDVLRAAGLSAADLTSESTDVKPRIVATYPYVDEAGALLYEVIRFSPKTFRQRRPDGAGGWTWKLGDVRRVLYRLPDLRGHEAVFIAEGEKDVESLRAIGLTATCNAGGAGKWRDQYSKQLAAAGVRRVAILPDHDEPGRRHALDVAASCTAVGIAARIVTLPDLPEHGDVSDWLARGHTTQELRDLANTRPAWQATSAADTNSSSLGPRPHLTRVADVKRESVAWLWPRRLARGKLAIVGGEPGEGKSTVTIDLAARISRGAPWPDGGTAPQGAVLLLSAEDGLKDTIAPRLDAAGADDRHVHVLDAVENRDGTTRALDLARDLPSLEAALQQVRPLLVVLDPVSAYLPKTDTWRDSDVRGVLAPLAGLADAYGCAVLAVMHLSKNGSAKMLHRLLGSVGFVAAARIVLAVATHPDLPERRLLLPVKNNLSLPADVLAFSRDADRIVWEKDAVMNVSADAVMNAAATDPLERQDAERFLRAMLATGEPVKAADVLRAARANGIAERTLNRVKARLNVRSHLIGFGKDGCWHWWLPPSEMASTPAPAPSPSLASEIAKSSEGATQKLATSGNLWTQATYRDCQEIAKPEMALSVNSLDISQRSSEIANGEVEGDGDERF